VSGRGGRNVIIIIYERRRGRYKGKAEKVVEGSGRRNIPDHNQLGTGSSYSYLREGVQIKVFAERRANVLQLKPTEGCRNISVRKNTPK
jgi:hypothetical protein